MEDFLVLSIHELMTNDVHYVTKEGLKKLEDELAELRERRKKVSDRIEEAIKMGDLSENAEYSDAKDEQAFVEGRIAEVEQILKNIEIIKKPKGGASEVALGCTVKLKFNGNEREFTIVGAEESDPGKGLISHESPLGSAFLGHKKGDKVAVKTPSGEMEYEILDIA